jgi:hypothetical protein
MNFTTVYIYDSALQMYCYSLEGSSELYGVTLSNEVWGEAEQAMSDWLAAGNTPAPYVPPEMPPEPTVKEKLATVGITIEDLKVELGLASPAPAAAEPPPVEPEWSSMTKADIAAYCQDNFGETLDTNQLKDELIARARELWAIAYS